MAKRSIRPKRKELSARAICIEAKSLDFLCDAHNELSCAINSAGGKSSQGLLDNYRFYSALNIGRASEGFIVLRKGGGIAASKFLIRSVIEMMIRLEAVRKKPELLYRIAWTETRDDKKWLRALAGQAGQVFDGLEYNKRWDRFKRQYKRQFPNHSQKDAEISLFDIAKAADMERYYNTHYRMYCRYTHAALRAIGGYLSAVADSEDNITVAICVLCAVQNVVSVGGADPNLKLLLRRRDAILEEKMTCVP